MIQRASILVDTERLPPDLQHQRLGDGVSDLVGGGDPEACLRQPGHVLVGSGERHRRMNGKRNAPLCGQWRQQRHTVGTGGVGDDRAAVDCAGRGEAIDQSE